MVSPALICNQRRGCFARQPPSCLFSNPNAFLIQSKQVSSSNPYWATGEEGQVFLQHAEHFYFALRDTKAAATLTGWSGRDVGFRGSEIALHFQYNKGNGNTVFLFLSSHAASQWGEQRVLPECKALPKGLELTQEKHWRSGRTEWQAATPQVQILRWAQQHYTLDTCLSLLQLPGHLVAPSLSHDKPHPSNTVALLAVDSEDTSKLFSCGEWSMGRGKMELRMRPCSPHHWHQACIACSDKLNRRALHPAGRREIHSHP